MAENQITLAENATVFSGNVPVEIPKGTVLTLPNVRSRDELAEALAQNQKLYAENRAQLAHEYFETREIGGEQKRVKVSVSYGIAGARVEEVSDAPAEQEQEQQPEGEQQPAS